MITHVTGGKEGDEGRCEGVRVFRGVFTFIRRAGLICASERVYDPPRRQIFGRLTVWVVSLRLRLRPLLFHLLVLPLFLLLPLVVLSVGLSSLDELVVIEEASRECALL